MNAKLIGGLMENSYSSNNNNEWLSLCSARRASLLKSTVSRFVKIQYSFIFRALLLCDKDYYSRLNWLVTGAVHIHSFFIDTCATLKPSVTHKNRFRRCVQCARSFRSYVRLFVCSTFIWLDAYAILCVQRAYWLHGINVHLCWHCQLFAFVLQQF